VLVAPRAPGHLVPLVAVAAACAPDLDLLPIVHGAPHRGVTHSVGAAVLAGLATFALAALRAPRARAAELGLVVLAAWSSHLVLDWLGADSRLPFGLMLFWPFSREFHVAPFPVFMDVGREISWRVMGHNLIAAAWEAALLVPALVAVRRARRA
jgi:membrane-bound metal-dependent hydrolase YbcI (DUF457 family)